jgi:hypothetical protein
MMLMLIMKLIIKSQYIQYLLTKSIVEYVNIKELESMMIMIAILFTPF